MGEKEAGGERSQEGSYELISVISGHLTKYNGTWMRFRGCRLVEDLNGIS
jgi:hypothetical protein